MFACVYEALNLQTGPFLTLILQIGITGVFQRVDLGYHAAAVCGHENEPSIELSKCLLQCECDPAAKLLCVLIK